MKTPYRERDSAYGAAMLTLRTALDLTRAELGKLLGVSRQTVRVWEAGSNYPRAEHLKELIALGVKQQAFAVGHEAEEIRVLWHVAGQKEVLDERWLSTLLDQQRFALLHVVPPPGATGASLAATAVPVEETISSVPVIADRDKPQSLRSGTRAPAGWKPQVDWGDALALPVFYGREEERALLSQWVVQEHCRVVSILGMGGIGKSALAVSIMQQFSWHFEVVIFRSLRDASSCEALLDDCLQVLSPQRLGMVPANLEQRINLLLEHLRKTRVLLVLDNLESLLEAGHIGGHLRPGFEGYGQLMRRIAERGHQSCLLFTSREKPAELRLLEGKYSQVRSLHLAGLDIAACRQLLLEEKGLIGTEAEQESLLEVYAGNPLALKIVAETIVDLFGGEIGLFLASKPPVIFGSITNLLDEQFARLSSLEQTLLCWLAIVREPVSLDELLALLVTALPRRQVLEGVDSLRRRSLVEHGKRPGSFTLQSVVLEYVTAVLIAQASSEIQQCRLNRLVQHGLEQAHAKEYVRQTQERLLLSPLLADLQSAIGRGQAPPLRRADGAGQAQVAGSAQGIGSAQSAGSAQGATPTAAVEVQLLGLLDQLRGEADSAQGYGPANLIALLRLQRGNLNGLNLSQLSIRGAYLQSIELQEASLASARIRDSAFTEAVSATWAVAISPDGRLWAASGMQGKVRVWDEGAKTLQRIWKSHY